MTALVVIVFLAVYAGMALGRWPRLEIDRTGIAILGAVLLVGAGAVDGATALAAIDFPTLLVLFGLMVLSAQFALAGFYDWCTWRLAGAAAGPQTLLLGVVLVSGTLSAVLANDVVVFSMTPMLCAAVIGRGLDPRPYLIALACAANVGSAATLIGNPQNIVIGQVGGLDFWAFLAVCGPPAALGLLVVWAVVALIWRGRLVAGARSVPPRPPPPDRPAMAKAVLALVLLLVLFATPMPHAMGVLLIAAMLIVSRRWPTRRLLGHVDWLLLALFAGLFVVTAAFAETGIAQSLLARLAESGASLDRLSVLLPLSLLASNSIGNVPAVVLLVAIVPDFGPATLTALALLSTFAGNLLLVGSLANIITAERAREAGVVLGFREHARCGIPITLATSALAVAWLLAIGHNPA